MEDHSNFGESFLKDYLQIKNPSLSGRYIHNAHIFPELEKLKKAFKISEEGLSVMGEKIISVEIGNGPVKVLAWSQMHGNETTTTKACFDVFNYLIGRNPNANEILERCTIKIIPILNPDAAFLYTRENANQIDLNRDAKKLSEIESWVLRKVLNTFSPDFCLNLHDQRSIYSAGSRNIPATLSFLAPASDETRAVNHSRKIAMQVIASIQTDLKSDLNQSIGRYDDAYNENCTGDTFMSMDIPTILFEAGHYPHDYQREETRKYVALSILSTLKNIASGGYSECDIADYLAIPENQKLFYDIIIRNVSSEEKTLQYGIQFKEVLNGQKIDFIPIVEEINEKINKYAHREIDAEYREMKSMENKSLKIGDPVETIFLNDKILSLKAE